MASRFRVVVTDDRYGTYAEEKAVLAEIGAELAVNDFKNEDEAIAGLAAADGVLVNLFPMTARVIASLARCRVLSRYGVGYDNVDLAAATAKGIWVARVPDYSIEDVSDQALALLLACVRGVAYHDRGVRAGRWNMHKELPTHRVAGRTLGLVGYGAIARCLHRKTGGLGLARVLVFDPYVDAAAVRKAGAEPVDLDTLLRESDYVSVHVPLGAETRGLIGARQLGLMKSTAILVNTSRGPVVDERAIAAALSERAIAAAGLDVFETEPLDPASPLRKLENAVLSDHMGWYSEESIPELKTKAARNVAAVLAGGKPVYPVNIIT
jgi:D-3-phosphoglycerate dehydrogenase / 2-oxoglutarate reductase